MDLIKELEARREEALEQVKAIDAVIEVLMRGSATASATGRGKLTTKSSNGRPRGEFSRAVLAVVATSDKSLRPIEVTKMLQDQRFDFGSGKTPAAARVSNELSRLHSAGTIRRRKGRYSTNKTGDSNG